MAALMSLTSKSQSCEPRFATEPTKGRKTIGPRLIEVSRKLGRDPMPWQERWLQIIGELIVDDETGIEVPAYPEAVLSIMRQQGKTSVAEAWIWDRLILWNAWDGKPQSVAYTAQKGADGKNKFRKDMLPTWRRSPLWKHVEKPSLAAENVGLQMRNGAFLSVLNTSESAGHGLVLDAAFMDEIFADTDNRREQTLVPAMATRHDRQKLIASAAGHDGSVLLNRKMALGRAAVLEGRNTEIAYLEYSADPKEPGYDPESPETWRKCMPALGWTITERMVRQAFVEMLEDPESGGVAEFERAWLNIPKSQSSDTAIPDEVWQAVSHLSVEVGRPSVLAVDANPNRTFCSVALADHRGNGRLEHYDSGESWVLARLVEKARRYDCPVALDMRGPVPHLADDLEAQGVRVLRYSTTDMVQACSKFWHLLGDRGLSVKQAAAMDAAAHAATKKPVGDAWLWLRVAPSDVSPLIALTMAVHAASSPVDPLSQIF